MRKRSVAVLVSLLIALVVAVPTVLVKPAAVASPGEQYSGPYFGENNFPPGCIRDMSADNPENVCYHMRTGLNALDSPQIDVLVMVPVSPTAERDMRIMRQSIEMWEGGIDYLADEMGLDWLSDGVDFHVTVDYIDPTGGEGGEFTTYPIVDPEIVVIATNPAGGIGIGIDPINAVFMNEEGVPCHAVENPLDFEYWENVPGFDSHHGSREGVYNEDCDGKGGNICFAINGAIDPAPETIDFFNLFDLVSHEVGHCLTLGHVGDGAEGAWGPVPTNDIMAYNADPPGLNKCVSTLDVEAFAVRMSRYLDVNGDGAVDGNDQLFTNDQVGQGGNAFQVQHPDDHLYASSTGAPADCPQPDLGLLPGERTDWTPEPVATLEPVLTVTSPADGSTTDSGEVRVTGTVEKRTLVEEAPAPTSPTASHDDADDDATTPLTEILDLDVAVTATHVEAVMTLAELWPSTLVTSATSYSLTVDGRKFDSFVRYPVIDPNPMTWDNGAAGYMPAGTSTWDTAAKTVTFRIPRDYLSGARIEAPYYVGSSANLGSLTTTIPDDTAPDEGGTLGVAGARIVGASSLGANAATTTFTHPDGNVFYPEESTVGVTPLVGIDPSHTFDLLVAETSDVELSLEWVGPTGASDLDLYATGAADSGTEGATADPSEKVVLRDVKGALSLRVEPYLVTDPLGTTYTLTATVTPTPTGFDSDGDGVADGADSCPDVSGNGSNGCPIEAIEHVNVYVGDALVATQDVDTSDGPDSFDIPVALAEGTHTIRIEWERRGDALASETRTVTRTGATTTPDSDGDGVPDSSDKCPGHPDSKDRDGDGIPDGCDKKGKGKPQR